ncbi:MAG: Crp/Fnr family transcriptional regulator [Methyloprofundus sp.]|nr:Crp/Fnr family transcriptional regulator [Methyloprofundus sp.]MBW6453451.1 Crp/Fnr family transcriptional regulator [Methyloprofundus sp.]
MELLRQNALFAGLNDEQFALVLAGSKSVDIQEGEVLFRQQQVAKYFYLLITGDIKLYRLSPEGAEKVIELIRPRQTFAEAVMFMAGGFYPVNAQALTDSRLIRVEMVMFRALLEHSPQSCLQILGHMSQRLHGAVQEIEQLTLQNAKMRVVQFLLRELPANASVPYRLQWSAPKTVIASRLSIRPETFSRILQQLIQEGVIRVDGKFIAILDIEALRQY